MQTRILSLLRELTAVPGPSGDEVQVARAFAKHLRAYTDDVVLAPFGNVVGTIRGQDAKGAILLSAHMDEVGLVVKHIEPDGFLRVDLNGSIDERALLATQVEVWTRSGPLAGVVGTRSRHFMTAEDQRRPVDVMDLWIQVGAESEAEAKALGVRIGDLITYRPNFQELAGGYVASKALDDRAGLAVILTALEHLPPRRDYDVYVVGSVQEEVGSRGARVAAQTLQPQIAIALDTAAGAEPGTPLARGTGVAGGGPVIRAWEWIPGTPVGTAYHRGLFRRIQEVAEGHAIAHQLDVARAWADAWEIAAIGHGIPTGGIYMPRRCAHSPCEIAKLSDIEGAARLLAAFLGDLTGQEIRALTAPERL